jgi:hypothetical protein
MARGPGEEGKLRYLAHALAPSCSQPPSSEPSSAALAPDGLDRIIDQRRHVAARQEDEPEDST